MPSEDTYAHGCRAHLYPRIEDLVGFVDHLHLFLGVAVVEEDIDVGKALKRICRGYTDTSIGLPPANWPACDASSAMAWAPFRTQPGSRHDDPLDREGVVDRLGGDEHLDRRAVGLAIMPL